MKVSQISNFNTPPVLKAKKIGVFNGYTGECISSYNQASKTQDFVQPKNILEKIKLTKDTLMDRLSYFKNKCVKNDAAYREDMLNDVLNNMVAKLNEDVYKNFHKGFDGFKPVVAVKNNKNGFSAVAYKQGNDIFVTYCGTNNKRSVISDLQMAVGKIPDQFDNADKFYNDIKTKYPECDITLTGHSLGGSLAQLVASKYNNVPAITLNAFGTDTIIKRNQNIFKDNHNVYNYIINGDFVSNTSKQVGKTVSLDKSYDKNYHDMPNYVNRWG